MLDIVIAITPRIVDDFGYTPAGPALLKGSLEAHGFTSKIINFNADYELEKLIKQQSNLLVALIHIDVNLIETTEINDDKVT